MDVKQAKAAILVESRRPLVVDMIDLPDRLEHGQVLVRLHASGICGAQLNEVDAVKAPTSSCRTCWATKPWRGCWRRARA
jgi:D-arabinose 1-dehydrogenase-like Zn-dependent alcohol dehydrogenase